MRGLQKDAEVQYLDLKETLRCTTFLSGEARPCRPLLRSSCSVLVLLSLPPDLTEKGNPLNSDPSKAVPDSNQTCVSVQARCRGLPVYSISISLISPWSMLQDYSFQVYIHIHIKSSWKSPLVRCRQLAPPALPSLIRAIESARIVSTVLADAASGRRRGVAMGTLML